MKYVVQKGKATLHKKMKEKIKERGPVKYTKVAFRTNMQKAGEVRGKTKTCMTSMHRRKLERFRSSEYVNNDPGPFIPDLIGQLYF